MGAVRKQGQEVRFSRKWLKCEKFMKIWRGIHAKRVSALKLHKRPHEAATPSLLHRITVPPMQPPSRRASTPVPISRISSQCWRVIARWAEPPKLPLCATEVVPGLVASCVVGLDWVTNCDEL